MMHLVFVVSGGSSANDTLEVCEGSKESDNEDVVEEAQEKDVVDDGDDVTMAIKSLRSTIVEIDVKIMALAAKFVALERILQ